MPDGDAVIWRPTDRQAEFLAAPEDEVLYGGSAGGGKTDALVIDALGGQCRAAEQPEYRALMLRRSYPELKEIVDRTQAIYPRVYPGSRYVEPEWRFPSGARLEFGYLDRDQDVMRYQSRQFQWIGWEELAHYQREYNKRLSEYKATPVHNWASHGADALRTMGVAHRTARIKQPKASWPPMQAGGGGGQEWLGT